MILQAQGVSKRYFRESGQANYFYAVNPTDITLPEGSLTVLMGRSGSGKTTLLNMLSGLLEPSGGTVTLSGTDLYGMDDRSLSRFRNRYFGVIPQGQTALHTLTVLENVLLPGVLYGGVENGRERAEQLLERFGIGDLSNAHPSSLSGGELRRMAIARALIRDPAVVLADEPTGDLDDENTALVLGALREIADQGTAVLVVTHESDALRYGDAAFRMDRGDLSPMAL